MGRYIANAARRFPRAFAVKLITDLRPRIRATANELIDRCRTRGDMDFIADFAALIPARVISDILGLPEADIPEFTRHIYNLARSLSSAFSSDDRSRAAKPQHGS